MDQTGRALVLYSVTSWGRQRGWNTVNAAKTMAAASSGQKLGLVEISAGYKAMVDSNAVQAHKITTARRGPCPRAISR